MSPRKKMLAGFLAANIAIAAVAATILLNRPVQPPQIQGVLLPQAREIPPFSVLDHHNREFTNADLNGRWHLVSYGFTTCPDICPTTLAQLAEVTQKLQEKGHTDLQILFYSVDHRRDTVEQLAAYVPFFDPGFIGLTHIDGNGNAHLPFEQGLGIVAQLVPKVGPDIDPADNEYDVNHGVTLFLLNPEGRLQAILRPDAGPAGQHFFNPDRILADYLAIRAYSG